MTMRTVKPANQRRRINTLRLVFVVLIPLIVFTEPGLALPEILMELTENVGILLVIAGVLGRFWSILYIGGRKNDSVVQDGPYSMCRHPLYTSSTLAVLGFGLMLGSLVMTSIMAGLVFFVLNDIARKEERFLRAEFGEAYDRYALSVPRLLPRISLFRTTETVNVNVATLRRNLFDAFVFLAFIPLGEFLEYFKQIHAWPIFPLY